MTDPFTDRYWIEEFQVTQADLERIAARIRETNRADVMDTFSVQGKSPESLARPLPACALP